MAEKYNICLDIGGTKVLGAVFDSKDNIVYRYKKKSAENGASSQNVEEVIVSVVDELLKRTAEVLRHQKVSAQRNLRRCTGRHRPGKGHHPVHPQSSLPQL